MMMCTTHAAQTFTQGTPCTALPDIQTHKVPDYRATLAPCQSHIPFGIGHTGSKEVLAIAEAHGGFFMLTSNDNLEVCSSLREWTQAPCDLQVLSKYWQSACFSTPKSSSAGCTT